MNNNYIESKGRLLGLYESIPVKEFLSRQIYYEIGEIQNMIICDMEKGFEDIPVQAPNKDEIDWIVENMNKIRDTLLLRTINDKVMSYIGTLTLFIVNWNNNVVNDDSITKAVKLVTNILDCNMTLRETINVNKIILDELIKYRDYKPVAYDTARHFQEKMDEKIRDGNITNERCK